VPYLLYFVIMAGAFVFSVNNTVARTTNGTYCHATPGT
jgi:hypothetical protein